PADGRSVAVRPRPGLFVDRYLEPASGGFHGSWGQSIPLASLAILPSIAISRRNRISTLEVRHVLIIRRTNAALGQGRGDGGQCRRRGGRTERNPGTDPSETLRR